MYRIYKEVYDIYIYYYLCDEDLIVIKWFYATPKYDDASRIFDVGISKLNDTYSIGVVKHIYESSDLQETTDQLEQIRILLIV